MLSTCNRTEIYFSSHEGDPATILKGLATIKGIPYKELSPYFTHNTQNDATVEYLFRVSMGLEAQVIGDIQISNQVKRAYQQSADMNLAGPFLHRLMHTIFFTNKRVVQETTFRDGAASVSYAAKELVQDLTNEIVEPRILIIGSGEIGEDVARNLIDSSIRNVTVVNRTRSKAEALAAECGFTVGDFEELKKYVLDSDVVISSVSTHEPIVTLGLIDPTAIVTHKFFIDLSVPRSVDLEIESVPGVLVYNIDDIQEKASAGLQRRMDAIPDVEDIIEEAISDFNDWSKEMMVSPTIKKLKNALEGIRQAEIEKYVRTASPEEVKIIDKATRSMVQKILKYPVLQLKAACQRGDADNLIETLTDLFDLEKEREEK